MKPGAKTDDSPVQIGCQGVFRNDVQPGGNFGAFTTGRPAAAMKAAGCEAVIIGHCEERNNLTGILAEAGCKDTKAVNRILNQEVKCAVSQGMKVLYCIGEKSEELEQWQEVLGEQLEIGLQDVDKSMVTIAYEPVWSIGPGKTPADKEYLAEAGCKDTKAVNRILNQEVKCAVSQGMKVLYCIGEKSEELEQWQEVLGEQLEIGLQDVDKSMVTIAYEPVWSIGPGKTPADKEYITKIARFVKEKTDGMDIVYGGGLKKDNAAMLASIPEIDGGLIALTRFQGEIGYYPEEYLEIISLYMNK